MEILTSVASISAMMWAVYLNNMPLFTIGAYWYVISDPDFVETLREFLVKFKNK